MAAFALQVTRSSYTTKETLDSLDVSGHEGCVSESGGVPINALLFGNHVLACAYASGVSKHAR